MPQAPINLDTEIVQTRHDPDNRAALYTIQRDGKRWTASIPLADLDGYGPNKQGRREHLAKALTAAMMGMPDEG